MTDEALRADLDEAIATRGTAGSYRLAALYRRASAEQRAALREGYPFRRRWPLPDLETILIPARGQPDPAQRVRAALWLQAVEDARIDYRDNLIGIAVLYHAALRLGLDAQALFAEVASAAGERMADLLREWLRRQPEDRCLWAFGWEERPTPVGLRFTWIGNDDDFAERRPRRLTPLGQVEPE